MQTTPVNDNIIQLTRLHFVNAYLVREDDGFTLIDTTVGGGDDGLIEAARSAGAEISGSCSPTATATTSDRWTRSSSDSATTRRSTSASSMPDTRRREGRRGQAARRLAEEIETAPDVRLVGGERIGSLEVVASPGHTPGHMAFLDTRDQTLIVGDVFTAYGGSRSRPTSTGASRSRTPATWDRPTDIESARKLRALDPRLLLVGHGPATKQPRCGDGRGDRAGSRVEQDG